MEISLLSGTFMDIFFVQIKDQLKNVHNRIYIDQMIHDLK